MQIGQTPSSSAVCAGSGRSARQTPTAPSSRARKAAEKGSLEAAQLAGELNLKGCDGNKNPAEAARWLRKAADKGSRDAAFSLGVLYFTGDGVTKDTGEARVWLEAAAAKGHPSAKIYIDRLGK